MEPRWVTFNLPEEFVRVILLSPYLFILRAEVLSAHFQHAESTSLLGGGGGGVVPTLPQDIKINHLFFAYDSLISCKVREQDWGQLANLLDTYERALGQRLNKDKSAVFFNRNTP
jgi:hypothetical protein